MSEVKNETKENVANFGNIEHTLDDLKVPQYVDVECHNSVTFMDCVADLCNKGFYPDKASFPHLKDIVLSVRLVKQVDINKWEEEVEQSQPFIRAMPLQAKHMKFDKEYVSSLSWLTFRSLMKACGITGRDRNKMTSQYLKLVENI